MKPFLRSPFASPAISAVIWIVISLATGGSLLFALGGGIVLLVLVYAAQEAYRRVVGDKHRAPS